ncbi:HD domain-containing protein [Candidatus Wolfebacteria bacterium]|nr:HD domain-containing protein [Candidatus Wolfebacteria bacterium]
MAKNQRDIEFLFEIGSLRNMSRAWTQSLGMDSASISEHTFRVVWLALIIARMEGVKNEEKIMKMALVHDLAESRTGDANYTQALYAKRDEDAAARDIFNRTALLDFYKNIFLEYEKRKSVEAKIVKDADNLDIDLETKEFDERGSKLPRKWAGFRRKVRDEKLYTESAKKIWDLIQDADPSDWHLKNNKWIKMPEAGR